MRSFAIALTAIIIFIAACNVSKKSTQSADAKPQALITNDSRMAASVASSDGVFAPSTAELSALRVTDKKVAMQTLTDGYKLYTGVCTNCHQPKSIYSIPESAWPDILISMADQANINDVQKSAINKYILAIKATQPHN